jgi:hypothetical protein
MISWLRQLDELLRGDRTRTDQLTTGRFNLSLSVFVPAAVGLGAIYGFFMGWYAIFDGRDGRYLHALAVSVKLPALFLLTLCVTFPSLYVFNALIGCRLSFMASLKLLVAAIVVNLAVGASLGPILGFFTVSTTSYPFMVLLNVALLGVAGVIGLAFLLRTLRALARASLGELPMIDDPPSPESDEETLLGHRAQVVAAREAFLVRSRQDAAANFIFRVWVLIYAVVGAQMGWILRPFIGSPTAAFTLFRPREGNFFSAVIQTIQGLMGL